MFCERSKVPSRLTRIPSESARSGGPVPRDSRGSFFRSLEEFVFEEITTDLPDGEAAKGLRARVKVRDGGQDLLDGEARPRERQAYIAVELARAVEHAPPTAERELLLAKSP